MDTNKLKELAERAHKLGRWYWNPSVDVYPDMAVDQDFMLAANPKAILGLIAEVERLNDELSACTEHPGGCGYWREAAKHRAEERDQIQAEIERFKDANREISETNIRRRDENVRLKAENEALRDRLQALIHISDATGWEEHSCGEIAKARKALEGTHHA